MNLTTLLRADSRAWRAIALVAGLAALSAVVSTHRVFSNMFDEPAQIATGMELLTFGTYTYEPKHPPLGRIAAAIGPWLAGARSTTQQLMFNEGRQILGGGERYPRMLALARLGELPFMVVILFTAWFWARHIADERAAGLAVLFGATNPNLLAHAGVAGTDIAAAAMMPAALFAWVLWLERPNVRRSIALGIFVALCGLSKFNAMAYLIPAMLAVAVHAALDKRGATREIRPRLALPVTIALSIAAFVTWGMYQFTVGRVGPLILPAPALWKGLQALFGHASGGHPAFLLGEVRSTGWWYFDLVVLLVKTPIPLLLLGVTGGVLAVRRRQPLGVVAAVFGVLSVMLIASVTRVEVGVRLLLALYVPLAVLAALGFLWLLGKLPDGRYRRALAAILVLWVIESPVRAHPDHLAYFNEFAGRHPERVLVDSNLDWGQDLFRLRDLVDELGIDSVRVHYFGSASFAAAGLQRARRLGLNERRNGWVAVSETFYAGVWTDTSLHWLRAHQPVARIGHSIRLYHIK